MHPGAYLRQIQELYPPLPSEEYTSLAVQAKTDPAKRDEMVLRNMGLIFSWVSRLRPNDLPDDLFLDLVQECVPSVLRAIELYDSNVNINPDTGKPHKFSTYASWWIRQGIFKALPKYSTFKMPSHVRKAYKLLLGLRDTYLKEHGHVPSEREAAELLTKEKLRKKRWTAEEVSELQQTYARQYNVRSLSDPVGNDDDGELILENIIEGSDWQEIVRAPEQDERRFHVKRALGSLPEEERETIILRYGLRDGIQRNLSEIASALGISKIKAKSYEEKALRRLRQSEDLKNVDPRRRLTSIKTSTGTITFRE